MSNSMHSASGSYHYSPAFGLDAVPEVGGPSVPAFAASLPDDGCRAPYGRRRFRAGQRAGWGGNDERTGGFRGVGAPAPEPLR
jgi:hypothetical protein